MKVMASAKKFSPAWVKRIWRHLSAHRTQGLALDWVREDDPKMSKASRLIERARIEIEELLGAGHSERLEQLTGLLHLAATYTEPLAPPSRRQLLGVSGSLLRRVFEVGTNDLYAPMESTAPAAFVVSYPRSGNTMVTQLAAGVLQGQIMENMDGALVPFSKKIYAKPYPYARIIKDHVARDYYRDDRCIFVVRDGRDTIPSLGYMTYKQGLHRYHNKSELPDLIRWLNSEYLFGGWSAHTRAVLDLLQHGDKMLVIYDEVTTSADVFDKVVRFIDPKHALPSECVRNAHCNRHRIIENIKNNEFANATWGIGERFPEGSMYHEWSNNRQSSSWRTTWTCDAKRAFHETGATESLIEFGFENDPNWWKD